jgi:hypothetical protein
MKEVLKLKQSSQQFGESLRLLKKYLELTLKFNLKFIVLSEYMDFFFY